MNILLVTGIFPPDRGGPASYVPRFATALAERGHEVEVICLSDQLDHDDCIYPFGVKRIRRSLFWPLRILQTMLAIWRAAWRNDLVYVNGLGAESAVAAVLAGRRTVHKVVGDYAWERAIGRRWYAGTLDDYQAAAKSLKLHVIDWVRTFPLQLAAQVIVPSRYLRCLVEGWKINPEKVCVIYNAVASSGGASAQSVRTHIPLHHWSGKTLITVCRLVPWKGVDALIRLLPELQDTRLVVVGDGPLRAELEHLAHSCGISERVVFLGDVPHNEVQLYLKEADAFVLNSSYEGLPHVVLEAMVAGIPVIATNSGGTGEVVENNTSGILVPVGNTTELGRGIKRLWDDPTLGTQLAAEATQLLSKRFSFEAMVDATEAILLSIVAPVHQVRPIRVEQPR
jgi:glycosyltransferase involved in cell wall biosynthesis